MNERIEKLAEQAGPLQEVLSEIYGGTPVRYVRNKALLDFQLEKFAELIVQECTTKMALEIMNNSWVDDAVKSTYQHFGLDQ